MSVQPSHAKIICAACVGEAFLHNEIQCTGHLATCSYCGRTGKTITIDDLADRVEQAFTEHFRQTSNEPSSFQQRMMANWEPGEPSPDFEPDGQPIGEAIQEAAGIDEVPAEDVREAIDEKTGHQAYLDGDESKFGEEDHYEEADITDERWQKEWATFEIALKTETRYFSRAAAATLASVFGGVGKFTTQAGAPSVVTVGSGQPISALHRARVFQSDSALEAALKNPENELGPPPSRAASAGRMNARGISVFYGATDPNCALGEVRPPVGSKVLVGKFDIIKNLELLDLSVLAGISASGSVFDPDFVHRLERAAFLSTLTQRLTRAVMPDDEPFDYLVTQAVADFLATEAEPALDGIIYPSVQSPLPGQFNVVLFHKASRVKASPSTIIEVSAGFHTEDGWEVDYTIEQARVSVPPVRPRIDSDHRVVSLELDRSSLVVHCVNAVRVATLSHSVRCI